MIMSGCCNPHQGPVLEPILYKINCIWHVGFELIHVIVDALKLSPYNWRRLWEELVY